MNERILIRAAYISYLANSASKTTVGGTQFIDRTLASDGSPYHDISTACSISTIVI